MGRKQLNSLGLVKSEFSSQSAIQTLLQSVYFSLFSLYISILCVTLVALHTDGLM